MEPDSFEVYATLKENAPVGRNWSTEVTKRNGTEVA
jgi:hypothetical protein